jgi:hypothetical protein
MNPTEIRQRVLPVLQDYFGVAAEFVLDDVMAAIPQSSAFDQRAFPVCLPGRLAPRDPARHAA